LEALAASFTDVAFSQSREDVATAIRERIYDPDKIFWIGNGVDVSRFSREVISKHRESIRSELGCSTNDVIILSIARIVREKGILELIETFDRLAARMEEIHLLLVGETLTSDYDCYRNEIQSHLRGSRFAKRVHLVGYRSQTDPYLAAADIFVLNSKREGMPRSILEAMAAGLPVIATSIRGNREEVEEEKTGFLYRLGDQESLMQRLELLSKDAILRKHLGDAGARQVARHFNEKDVLLYQQLLLRRVLRKGRLDDLDERLMELKYFGA
jgi:glycosyltransferase involved in cell wall biosynthesis